MKEWKQHQGLLKLAGMVVLVPLVAWTFGFRQTVSLWRECEARQETVERLSADGVGKVAVPRGEVLVGKQVLNNGVLLECLTPVVKEHGVSMTKYTPYLTREEGKLQVHTGELVLSGGFISLLKVIHHIERDGSLGKIVSAGFQVYRERERKTRQLRVTLVIQQLVMEN